MSTPAPASSQEPLDYRPLSGLALAGFAVAAAYAAIITIGGALALQRGQPFLLSGWMLLLPLAGALVSYLGQMHVRNSDGTRAGLQLARWGLWLSVGFGLAYFVYSLGTGLAIRQQANTTVSEFLEALAKGGGGGKHFNQAFLATEKPSERDIATEPDAALRERFGRPLPSGNPGPLYLFRDDPLVRFFACGAPAEMKFEPLGVVSWRYEGGGFRVERLYRLSNEQATAEAIITARSVEGQVGQTRAWQISMRESVLLKDKVQPKPIDAAVRSLRDQALTFAVGWAVRLNRGESWKLPDEADALVADRDSAGLFEHAQKIFAATTPGRLMIEPTRDPSWLPWGREEGKLRFTTPVIVRLAATSEQPELTFYGWLDIRSKETVGALDVSLTPDWEIHRLTLDQAVKRLEKDSP